MPEVLRPTELAAPPSTYSHGMAAAGAIVVVAGQAGVDRSGRPVGDDVEGQTRQALENVRAVLASGGCTMRDVVRMQTFLVRAEDIAGFRRARETAFAEYFAPDAAPPHTLVVVSRLARPELLVEIEAMAVRPRRRVSRRAGDGTRRRPARRRARR